MSCLLACLHIFTDAAMYTHLFKNIHSECLIFFSFGYNTGKSFTLKITRIICTHFIISQEWENVYSITMINFTRPRRTYRPMSTDLVQFLYDTTKTNLSQLFFVFNKFVDFGICHRQCNEVGHFLNVPFLYSRNGALILIFV